MREAVYISENIMVIFVIETLGEVAHSPNFPLSYVCVHMLSERDFNRLTEGGLLLSYKTF